MNEEDKITATESEQGSEDANPLVDDAQAVQDGIEGAADPLRQELDQALAAVEKHKDETLRAMAELDNVRKRAERDVEAAHKFGIERFINELLPVKDSMDLGFDAANSADDVEALREGMALTLKMFDAALEKGGVAELYPVGEKFDPEFHQAMMMEESVEVESGTILRVMQKGYTLNDRLIGRLWLLWPKPAADG